MVILSESASTSLSTKVDSNLTSGSKNSFLVISNEAITSDLAAVFCQPGRMAITNNLVVVFGQPGQMSSHISAQKAHICDRVMSKNYKTTAALPTIVTNVLSTVAWKSNTLVSWLTVPSIERTEAATALPL